MPKTPKAEAEKLPENKRDRRKSEKVSEQDLNERSYYYDDAHGYEDYVADEQGETDWDAQA